MKRFSIILSILVVVGFTFNLAAQSELDRETRLTVLDGNKLYKQKRFAEAEAKFKKALESAPSNDVVRYNLAATYIQESGGKANDQLIGDAMGILEDLSRNSTDSKIAELASYNAGNIMFNNDKYKESIDFYKQALRKNPDNDKARENLRLAQLKLQQNDNDKNQDQNQDQDKNKDKNDQQQNQNQDQNNDQQQNQNQQPQQRKQELNDQNAETILKTMQNEENRTRQKIEARKKKDSSRRQVTNPW